MCSFPFKRSTIKLNGTKCQQLLLIEDLPSCQQCSPLAKGTRLAKRFCCNLCCVSYQIGVIGSKINIFQIQTSNLVFEWLLHSPIWSNGYKGSKVPGLLLFLHRHQRKQKGRRRNKCPFSKNPGSPLLRLLSATSHHPLLQWKWSVSASWIRSWRFKMCYFVRFMCTVLDFVLSMQ